MSKWTNWHLLILDLEQFKLTFTKKTIQPYVDFEYYNLGMMNLYFASLWQDYELPFLLLNMI